MEGFFEKYKQKINENCVSASNDNCKLWTGAKTKDSKYGVICFKHPELLKWKTMHVHRLSRMIYEENIAVSNHLDASHLCHNSLCVEPSHIIFEHHGINCQRLTCATFKKCTGHVNNPDCLVDLML